MYLPITSALRWLAIFKHMYLFNISSTVYILRTAFIFQFTFSLPLMYMIDNNSICKAVVMVWCRCDKSKRYLRCLRYIRILERTMCEHESIHNTNLMMTLTTHYERIDALLRRYDNMITSFVIWLFRLSFRGIDCISLLYCGMILVCKWNMYLQNI